VRSIATKILWKEPQWIGYALYSSLFWVLLLILVSAFLWNNYIGAFITLAIAVLGFVVTVFALIFGPKLYVLFFTKDGTQSGSRSTTTARGGSSDFSTNFKPDKFNSEF